MCVRSSELPEPFRGDLDGLNLYLKPGLEPEETLFLLVHLFGHTVQWNVSARARELGAVAPPVPPGLLPELEAYEQEACRYGLGLLHLEGVFELDQWLTDLAACDFLYLRHFYVTGQRRPVESFWRSGLPCLTPLMIPPFRPVRWKARSVGIVL